MKIEKEFVLREIAGDYIIVPIGTTALELNGMITVNETGAFLWRKLCEETTKEELVCALQGEYEVTEEEANEDVEEFLETLYINHIL